jgi:hypothetical protein
MKTAAILRPKPGDRLWGIYYTDREYARLLGDPLRTVVEAPTKLAAEEIAGKLGFESPWAHPVTSEQAKQALLPQKRQSAYRQHHTQKRSHGIRV